MERIEDGEVTEEMLVELIAESGPSIEAIEDLYVSWVFAIQRGATLGDLADIAADYIQEDRESFRRRISSRLGSDYPGIHK
jgi:hypothetical protein